MNTQELKQQIDKVLGNSIRCLLPSYWWKKLFYNVVDTIDNSKEELEKIVIDSLDEFEKTHPSIASRTFYWTSDENSEEASKNKSLAIKTLMAMSSAINSGIEYYNNPFYIAVPISFDDRYADTKFIISHQYYFDRRNTKISFPEVYIGGECFDIEFDLYGDYGVPTTQPSNNSGSSVVVDSSLSETSTNPVQNKVITSEISKITSSISKIAPTYYLISPNKVKEYYEASINETGLLSPPRGFTIESGGATVEVDTFDIVSETEFCVEFNFYDKRYRKVFNKTSGELVRTDTISSAVTEIKMNGTSMGTSGAVDLGTVITGVKINGTTKTQSNGVVDLGTVVTEHQMLKTINGESIVGSGNIALDTMVETAVNTAIQNAITNTLNKAV